MRAGESLAIAQPVAGATDGLARMATRGDEFKPMKSGVSGGAPARDLATDLEFDPPPLLAERSGNLSYEEPISRQSLILIRRPGKTRTVSRR